MPVNPAMEVASVPASNRHIAPLLALCCLALPAASAQEQHEEHPDHAHLAEVSDLGFAQIVQAALQNAPRALEAPVRAEQAAAWRDAGDSWLAGRPSLVYNHYDDRSIDDRGQQEFEWGVQLPLRRPGEFAAARRQGEQYTQQSTAWQQSLLWQLAGEVRARLAAIEVAELDLHIEAEATATAQELVGVTRRLFTAGAVARLEVLQAESMLLAQQRALLDAEAALVDAEREYTVLTGLTRRPAEPHREQSSPLLEIPDDHPWLRLLQAEVAVAEGNVRQNEISNKGSPQLTFGTRRERGDRFTPYTDALSLTFSVPFGGKSWVSAQTSAARMQQVDTEVQLHAARRDLQRLLHEAEHSLFVTREALPLAQQEAALGEERSAMARAAFAAGELTLQQVLPAVQEATRARRAWQSLQLQEQRLIADYNQYVGVLP